MRKKTAVLLLFLLGAHSSFAFSIYEKNSVSSVSNAFSDQELKKERVGNFKNFLKGSRVRKEKEKKGFSFKGEMPLDAILKELSSVYGLKYELSKNGENFPVISLNLKTESLDGLVKKACKSADYYCVKENGVWKVNRYETFSFPIPKDFNYNLKVSSGSDSANLKVEGDFLKQIKSLLTSEGKVVRSSTGFFFVVDRPSGVERVKKFLLKEVELQKPIKIKITVIRFTQNKSSKRGIDWNAILTEGSNSLKVDFNSTSLVSGTAFSFAYKAKGVQTLLKLLSEYGNAQVEKVWEFITRSGRPVFTKNVKEVPWATQQTMQNSSTATSSTTVHFKSVGLKIKVVPYLEGDTLKGTIYTEMSDLLDMVDFGNGIKAPETFVSSAMVSFSVPVGESIVITGLEDLNTSQKNSGLPVLKDVPVIGSLFSYREKEFSKSKIIVVITPEPSRV